MIVRKEEEFIILIEQNHHGHIAEQIIQHWHPYFLINDLLCDSVLYAIKFHDYGWQAFDQEPFWNDEKQFPYSFIDFPLLAKLTLYTYGVDRVQEQDKYAAALCSAHYSTFLKKSERKEVLEYLKREEKRREKIFTHFPNINNETFQKHLGLLQLADNLSLYIALNERGVSKEKEHYFFKEGIPISRLLSEDDVVHAYWENKHTVKLSNLPKVEPFTVTIKQKRLSLEQINREGYQKAYTHAPYEEVSVTFKM